MDPYTRVLETTQLLLNVLQAEITEFNPHIGIIAQSAWDPNQTQQIKTQLLGMLKLIPDSKVFNQSFEG